jgi:ribose transport system permease protein
MKKLLGLFMFVLLLYASLWPKVPAENRDGNHANMLRRVGQYGIISLGVGTLIVAGGIDLSMGSFIGLCSTVLAVGMSRQGWSPSTAVGVVLALAVGVGLLHGVLATKCRLQPFVVTLCGLFAYRGLARWYAGDTNAGMEGKYPGFRDAFSRAEPGGIPIEFIYLVVAVVLFGLFLHRTVYGRYLFAIGSNELAAKYSGIHVDRYKIAAYVICSLTAAFFSMMHLAEIASIAPSGAGEMMELYAIAGAVLGGCSLRGGEGTVAGIVLGAAIPTLIQTAVNFWEIPQALEYTAMGGALLVGALLDEVLRRRNALKRG